MSWMATEEGETVELEGDWIGGWDALDEAERMVRKYGVFVKGSIASVLASMAAAGHLPTISNEVTHSEKIPEGEEEEWRERAREAPTVEQSRRS